MPKINDNKIKENLFDCIIFEMIFHQMDNEKIYIIQAFIFMLFWIKVWKFGVKF
jgi:hypothetical protein